MPGGYEFIDNFSNETRVIDPSNVTELPMLLGHNNDEAFDGWFDEKGTRWSVDDVKNMMEPKTLGPVFTQTGIHIASLPYNVYSFADGQTTQHTVKDGTAVEWLGNTYQINNAASGSVSIGGQTRTVTKFEFTKDAALACNAQVGTQKGKAVEITEGTATQIGTMITQEGLDIDHTAQLDTVKANTVVLNHIEYTPPVIDGPTYSGAITYSLDTGKFSDNQKQSVANGMPFPLIDYESSPAIKMPWRTENRWDTGTPVRKNTLQQMVNKEVYSPDYNGAAANYVSFKHEGLPTSQRGTYNGTPVIFNESYSGKLVNGLTAIVATSAKATVSAGAVPTNAEELNIPLKPALIKIPGYKFKTMHFAGKNGYIESQEFTMQEIVDGLRPTSGTTSVYYEWQQE